MKKAILNKYALNGYTVHSNLPIGAPMPWLSDNLPVGFLAFDGSEYNQSDYPELYNVVKNIPSFHSETEGKFKIPNLKGRVLQGADTVIGELIEAGLPNIEGEVLGKEHNAFSSGVQTNNAWESNGALEIVKGGQAHNGGAGYFATALSGITINASKSNPIYGNNDTVQPPAFTVRWIIKATQYATVEQNAIDDTRFTTGNVLSAQKTKELTEENYSTEERVIGKWIDGKTLYRTVLELPRVETQTDVSYLNIDTLKSISGFGCNSTSPQERMDINFNNSWYYAMYYNMQTKKLMASGSSTIINGVVILEYTKTTD